jgi:hypothetical protein
MRGIVTFVVTVFAVLLGLYVGVAMVEPFVDIVQEDNAAQSVGAGDMIDNLETALFQAMPLILIGGLGLGWSVLWYLRRERGRFRS